MAAPRATCLQQILRSRSIKFIVGKGAACYMVHEAALDRLCLSGSFARYLAWDLACHKKATYHDHGTRMLPNEPPKLSDTVIWDAVEEEVFIRLVEYAYQGDYSVPALARLDDEDDDLSDHDIASLDYRLVISGDQYPNVASFFYLLGKQFQEQAMKPFSHPNQAASEAFIDDIKKKNRSGHYTVFMCHIKLYELAQQFDIRDLENLCKERLRKSLLFFPHCERSIGDFFQAVTFVREKVFDSSEPENLQSLLLDFLVIEFSRLKQYPDFEEVLAGDASFACDFIDRLPGGFRSQWRA